MYKVKEIYYTIQGEGVHAGQPAVFCRFTGCNLWSGREEDRHKAICQFCDTDFVNTNGINGGKYTGQQLVDVIRSLWPSETAPPWVVFTGGEPLLQLDSDLIGLCKQSKIHIAVETNGTIEAPQGIDWLCVSPKANSEVIQKTGHELKLVYPQKGLSPEQFENWDFGYFSIQPMDSEEQEQNILASIEYCTDHPRWRLSVQLHKILGLP